MLIVAPVGGSTKIKYSFVPTSRYSFGPTRTGFIKICCGVVVGVGVLVGVSVGVFVALLVGVFVGVSVGGAGIKIVYVYAYVGT